MYEKRGELREARRHWNLAQASIRKSDSTTSLPLDDELTIEMFKDLLDYRLNTVSGNTP